MGNKCDMDESKRKVPYSQGQALADEFGIQFFETSAKNNIKVDEVSAALLMIICQAAHTRLCTFQSRSLHFCHTDSAGLLDIGYTMYSLQIPCHRRCSQPQREGQDLIAPVICASVPASLTLLSH